MTASPSAATTLRFDAPVAAPGPFAAPRPTGLTADHQWLATFLGLASPLALADIGAADYGEINAFDDLARHGMARKYAFEPEDSFFQALRARDNDRHTTLPYALGDGREHTLHVCPAGMTSLLEPDPAALAFFNGFEPWGEVQRKVPMPTRRLAEVEEVAPLHFVKIDVQGSELMILENGGAKLDALAMLQIEVSFVALYKNQPTFGEIDVFMRARGFIPHHMYASKRWIIAPTVMNNDVRRPLNQLLEADLVYIRDVVHPEGIDDMTLRRTAYLAETLYESLDLSIRCVLELVKRGLLPEGSHLTYAQGYGDRLQARRQRQPQPR
jgi:FkbM family methyltransferase